MRLPSPAGMILFEHIAQADPIYILLCSKVQLSTETHSFSVCPTWGFSVYPIGLTTFYRSPAIGLTTFYHSRFQLRVSQYPRLLRSIKIGRSLILNELKETYPRYISRNSVSRPSTDSIKNSAHRKGSMTTLCIFESRVEQHPE